MKAFFAAALLIVSAAAMAEGDKTGNGKTEGTGYGTPNTEYSRMLTCQITASSAEECIAAGQECLEAADDPDQVIIDCTIVDPYAPIEP